MKYGEILKRSLSIIKINRYFWGLGLLLGSGFNLITYSISDSSELLKLYQLEKLDNGTTDSSGAILVKAAENGWGKVLSDSTSDANYILVGIIASIIFLFLVILLIYLSLVARGAITHAAIRIDKGEKTSNREAWKIGKKFFWRRLSFSLLLILIIFLPIVVLAIPPLLLGIWGQEAIAVILGIIFLLVLVIYLFYLSLITPIAERELFLENKKPKESLLSGVKFFNRNWLDLIILYLILFGVEMLYAVAVFLVFAIGGGIIFGLAYLAYLLIPVFGYIFGGILGLAFIVALIILSGAFSSFSWTAITLGYKDLKHLKS